MLYQVANLTFEVEGNGKMDSRVISYERETNKLFYTRVSNIAVIKKNNVMSSGENASPDDSCFSIEEIQLFKEESKALHTTKLNVKVSGCPFCDEKGNSSYVLRRMADYAVQKKAGAAQDNVFVPDFRIQYQILPEISMPKGAFIGRLRGFHCFSNPDGSISLIRRIDELDEVLAKIDIDANFQQANIEVFDVSGLGGLGLEERLHAYIGEAFAYLALSKGRLVFHSSALAYECAGICFSAPSGTGKSTHTALWKQYYGEKTEIINDDTPVLYIEDEKTVLSGSPWSGKTELNINKQIPLKGIVFLTRSKDNFIRRLTNLEAIQRIFTESKILQIPELFDSGIAVVSKILEKTPVYLLGCNISKDAVDLVKNTLQL